MRIKRERTKEKCKNKPPTENRKCTWERTKGKGARFLKIIILVFDNNTSLCKKKKFL